MNTPNSTILPLTYLGNILYYIHLIKGECIIDIHSHYIKQTYTNRCTILSTNGPQDLTIPIIKPKEKTPIKDIRISSHDNWQQLHWRTIQSAYNSTPFFEYFCDDYIPFYEKKWDFLLDFNLEIQQKTLELLNFKKIESTLSGSYIKPSNFIAKESNSGICCQIQNCTEWLSRRIRIVRSPPFCFSISHCERVFNADPFQRVENII